MAKLAIIDVYSSINFKHMSLQPKNKRNAKNKKNRWQ